MADERMYDGQSIPEGERVGFCQDCGKPLSATTIRNVGSGVFCEPCLERRVAAGTAGAPGFGTTASGYAAGQAGPAGPTTWQTYGGAYPPPPPVPPAPGTIYTGAPSPVLAGFLGFIPGVGAMYNGQFAKGVVHLVIFAVLVSLSDHVNGIFGLFVAGWVFYMAFDAYHTARARRDGLPLPDPFGFNNIGERLGFGKNWPGSFTGGVSPTQGNAAWQTPPPPTAQAGGDWVGYVPPTNYATTPGAPVPPPAATVPVEAVASVSVPPVVPIAPYQAPVQTPYGTNIPYSDMGSAAGVPPAVAPARKFPVGAIWLIGLGLLFLIGNINHALHVSWIWLGPLLIGGFAIYLLVTRLRAAQAADTLGRPFENKFAFLRGPVMMLTVAVLWILQSLDVLTFGQSWPVLLVVLGALLVLERSSTRKNFAGPMPVIDSDVNASPASWNTPKGGQ